MPTVSTNLSGLPAGDYTVVVDESTLPPALNTQTLAPTLVNLSAGESSTGNDFGYAQIVTNPIILGNFETEPGLRDGDILFRWTTANEVGNVGFNLYARDPKGKWRRINQTLIPSKVIDATSNTSYEFTAYGVQGRVFGLGDVDLFGNETLHGPFRLGSAYGVPTGATRIDWGQVRQEHHRKKANRKLRKQRGMNSKIRRFRAMSSQP